ncbi:hypothetical protein Glove_352g66 [Diversispora epigaea]|uniref:Uncharacterized protein n=1 Tax=Diversispora epigaea TaxID=1348612 RepID=A0A397HG72_9GLOM|nr:hypothetical protein Glove_352g66 [Diversispora epigaea]
MKNQIHLKHFKVFLDMSTNLVKQKDFLIHSSKQGFQVALMSEYLRKSAFIDIANGEFAKHKNKWMTIYKQKVIEYKQKYDDKKLNYFHEAMPCTIHILVNQEHLLPAKDMKDVKLKLVIQFLMFTKYKKCHFLEFFEYKRNLTLVTCQVIWTSISSPNIENYNLIKDFQTSFKYLYNNSILPNNALILSPLCIRLIASANIETT